MTKLNLNYLNEENRLLVLTGTKEERIHKAKEPKWIKYAAADKLIDRFELLLSYPKRDRMPNVLVFAESNNGKTVILNRFYNKYEAYVDEVTGKVIKQLVLIQAPPTCDERRLYNVILDKLHLPIKTRERIEETKGRVIDVLKELEVKVLIIDEIHNFLSGTGAKQRVTMNALRYLANELKIPIIAAGTNEALSAVRTDKQMANRFKPFELKVWKYDTEYAKLLKSYISILPLKRESRLLEPAIAEKILTLSNGLIGEISDILEQSTIVAIESGVEEITLDILESLDFEPPNNRIGW